MATKVGSTAVVDHIVKVQKLCKQEKQKDGLIKVISGVESWKTAYKKRPEIDQAYQDMYNVLLEAYDQICDLSKEVKDLKAKAGDSTQQDFGTPSKTREMENLKAENDRLQEYRNIFSKMEEGFTDWKKEIQDTQREQDSSINVSDFKDQIEKCVPGIVRDIAKETCKNKDFQKSWASLFKTTQDDLKDAATKTLDKTLKTVIGQSQAEIIRSTVAKHDQNDLEKQRRARNIVIRDVPVSDGEQPLDRIESDKKWISAICDLPEKEIVRCYRVGESKDGRPKLLVGTLSTPGLAQHLHNFGNGRKCMFKEDQFWINPDLTASERVANYKARLERKRRRAQVIGAGGNNNEVKDKKEVEVSSLAAKNQNLR